MTESLSARTIATEGTIATGGTGTPGTEIMTGIGTIEEIAIESIAGTLTPAPAHPAETTDVDTIAIVIVRTTGVETDILLRRGTPTITLVANIDWHILTDPYLRPALACPA